VTEFFNTAIILLLLKSNFSDTGIPFMSILFNDKYYDFDHNWYDEIGSALTFTIFYSALWPMIEFVVFYGMRVLFRFLDSWSILPSKYKTNKSTIQQYVDTYGGPEYLIYWKYSRIINLAWVTFMFGPGIPILYPTFLLALIIQYCVERLCMAYYYKQPPMYDDTLNKNSVNLLYYAFALQMFVGYWMYSNKQIFTNEVKEVTKSNSSIPSNHSIWDPIQLNQAFPFLAVGVIFIASKIIHVIIIMIADYREKHNFTYENLKKYTMSLKQYDKVWLKSEEKYIREKENFRLLPDETYRKLVTSGVLQLPNALTNKNFIQNVPTYDILANPKYEERFQYFPAMMREDLDDDLFMSEKIRKIINLPYLTRNQLTQFEFSSEIFKMISEKVCSLSLLHR